jgi:hypothetical protein
MDRSAKNGARQSEAHAGERVDDPGPAAPKPQLSVEFGGAPHEEHREQPKEERAEEPEDHQPPAQGVLMGRQLRSHGRTGFDPMGT